MRSWADEDIESNAGDTYIINAALEIKTRGAARSPWTDMTSVTPNLQ